MPGAYTARISRFSCYDLDLDPITLIYELDIDIMHTKTTFYVKAFKS